MELTFFGLIFLSISVIPVEGKVALHRSHGIPPTRCDLTVFTFDQLIDHNDPSLGTFKQRYWLNADDYRSGTGPTVL